MIEQKIRYGHGGLMIMNTYPKYYMDALYQTLTTLKPKNCLEIGTHQYGSASVFQDYFNDNMNDGELITCDIFHWSEKPEQFKNVTFRQVYPHFHHQYIFENEYRIFKDWRYNFTKSIELNTKILNDRQYDFAFIDADHRAICLSKDLIMCDIMNIKYILLEDVDIEELIQESGNYYHEVIKKDNKFNFYEFDNWDCKTNCALLIRK